MSDDVKNAPSKVEDLKVGMGLKGTVKRLELYGAFVDIGVGQDALLHISQLGKKVQKLDEHFKPGDQIDVYVLKIDDAGRVALSAEKPPERTWNEIKEGETYPGTVVRIEKFGVFVDIGAERPGMVHVSELAEGFVKDPVDVVSAGQEVQVRVLKVNRKKRQIDLSMKTQSEAEAYDYADDEDESMMTAMEIAFRRAQQAAGDKREIRAAREAKRERRRNQQDDIIARTLRHHQG
jgi:ribosomal protein S1